MWCFRSVLPPDRKPYRICLMSFESGEVSQILDRWSRGEPEALSELMPKILGDLRRVAQKHLAQESPGHTLQPTALVNEVYLRLKGKRSVHWRNKAQFFAFVAGMMRRILVDHARGRQASKRGGQAVRLSLDDSIRVPEQQKDPDLLALDDALKSLEKVDPRQCRIVEMRYFTGLSVPEIAEVEGISGTTVKREWQTAKMWLFREVSRR